MAGDDDETSECSSGELMSDNATIIVDLSPTSPADDVPTLDVVDMPPTVDLGSKPQMEFKVEEAVQSNTTGGPKMEIQAEETVKSYATCGPKMELKADEVLKEELELDTAESSTRQPKTEHQSDVAAKDKSKMVWKPTAKPNGATARRWKPDPTNKYEVALRKIKDDKNRRETTRKAKKALASFNRPKPAHKC